MKISCPKDHLVERLSLVARAASTRPSLQIASGILVRAEDPERPVELAATDRELALRVPLIADVLEVGSFVLPSRLGLEVIRSLPSDVVELSYDAATGMVRIDSKGGSYQLHALRADDFPALPEIDHEKVFEVDRASFVETAERVGRAASRDESRPALTGVLMKFEAGQVTMAATDAYRMAVKELPLSDPIPGDLEAIVPRRAVEELPRIAAVAAGSKLQVAVTDKIVAFGLDDVWLTARRIEGQFPNFRSIRPAQFEHQAPTSRSEAAEVVRRVGLFARNAAPIRLSFSPGELRISARTPDVGEAVETIPTRFEGEPLEIGFNAEYLRDGIDAVGSEDLVFQLVNPTRPALLTNGEDDSFWYLIMPMRLT